MTREDRITQLINKEYFKGWTRKDIEEELNGYTEEEISNGYSITDFDGTGMLEIQRCDYMAAFEDDEKAVEQAIKDGVAIIPVEELPENFDRRYLGWVDTPGNRERIVKYCEER